MKTLSSAGSLVGLWSPGFSSAFSVAGYHFHFLSEDRQEGGRLLDCESGSLRVSMEALTDFPVCYPYRGCGRSLWHLATWRNLTRVQPLTAPVDNKL